MSRSDHFSSDIDKEESIDLMLPEREIERIEAFCLLCEPSVYSIRYDSIWRDGQGNGRAEAVQMRGRPGAVVMRMRLPWTPGPFGSREARLVIDMGVDDGSVEIIFIKDSLGRVWVFDIGIVGVRYLREGR